MSLLEYNIMKARHGRYADTAENRRLHRVGQEYGHAAKEEPEAGPGAKKGGDDDGGGKRTYDTARKELSTVLSNKDEFIKKYGQDEFDRRVGALVGEARELRSADNQAAADRDFEEAKKPSKPEDNRSKKEKRTERLEKYKEQLRKVQEKMGQEGETEESRKMGEALEAKWKAKIEKLEAKVNRGRKPDTGAGVKEALDSLSGSLAKMKNPNASDAEREAAKEEVDAKLAEIKEKFVEPEKELSYAEKRVLKLLSQSSSKYNDISKVEVRETPKGNWELVYDGKEVSIVNRNQFDHDELLGAGLLKVEETSDSEWLPWDSGFEPSEKLRELYSERKTVLQDAKGYDKEHPRYKALKEKADGLEEEYNKLRRKEEDEFKARRENEEFEAFVEKFEKDYRRDPSKVLPTKSSEIREMALKEWNRNKNK